MLYIFDSGSVIVDIGFNHMLGIWSDLSRVPLASLKQGSIMGGTFHQHRRGEIMDEVFAKALCHDMTLPLSYEQSFHGWQAVFVTLRSGAINIMQKLREQGHRVVVLSNTSRSHMTLWSDEYSEIRQATDHIYLSQNLGMCKPEARIYQHALQSESFSTHEVVSFDDNADNIGRANRLGIIGIQVVGRATIPDYFAKLPC